MKKCSGRYEFRRRHDLCNRILANGQVDAGKSNIRNWFDIQAFMCLGLDSISGRRSDAGSNALHQANSAGSESSPLVADAARPGGGAVGHVLASVIAAALNRSGG